MNNKSIEEKALNELKSFIEDSDVISQFISEDDKEPCWDGHLYLFSKGKRDNKKYLLGRVPVQIKGTEVDSFYTKNWKFKLEKNDLKAYLHEPTFFIVCKVKKGSREKKLFYKELLPNIVNTLLKDMGTNKSIMTPFLPLTENLEEFENQLCTFMTNSKKMVSFADNPPMTIEDARIKGVDTFSFVAPINPANITNLLHYLSTHHSYLYAKLNEWDINIPISNGPMKFAFQREMNIDIKVGDRVFYKTCKNKIEDGRLVIVIDDIMAINLPIDDKDTKKPDIKFEIKATNLSDYIHEAEFIIDLHNSGVLTIGKQDLYIAVEEVTYINELKDDLACKKKLQSLLEKLHVTKQLDLTGLTNEQEQYIEMLIETIINGNPVKIPNMTSQLLIFEISNVKLLIGCAISKDGYCIFRDFFDNSIGMSYQYEDKIVKVSPYSFLKEGNLWECCDNINYNNIIPSIKKFCEENPFCFKMSYYDMLAIIKASDNLSETDQAKSKKLLKVANDLCLWLLENDTNKDTHLNLVINNMQIVKRQRELSLSEIDDLHSYLHSDETTNKQKACIYILLENKEKFDAFFSLLADKEKEETKQNPIWKLKKQNSFVYTKFT